MTVGDQLTRILSISLSLQCELELLNDALILAWRYKLAVDHPAQDLQWEEMVNITMSGQVRSSYLGSLHPHLHLHILQALQHHGDHVPPQAVALRQVGAAEHDEVVEDDGLQEVQTGESRLP